MSNARTSAPCHLAGLGVLVTRPAAQAEGLCRLVEAAGGRAVRFPTIAVEPLGDSSTAKKLLTRRWDIILFISRNAVAYSLPLFPGGRLPKEPRLGAVGAATAKALSIAGRTPGLTPAKRFDSESLLALPELENLADQLVLIVRGSGGRTLLGDTLKARGAQVAYAEVYRRTLPPVDITPLLARWREEVQLVTATSGEILDNLLALAGSKGRELLLSTPLVLVSERTAKSAKKRGFARIEVARNASDAEMVAALCRLIEVGDAG